MQTLSTITKTKTRVDQYYTTTKGTVIQNGLTGELTVSLSSSDMVYGAKTLEFALSEILWNLSAPIKTETISWLDV